MSNYAADDTQAIAQRLKEIEAEKQVALTGTSAPVTGQEEKADDSNNPYGMYGYTVPAFTGVPSGGTSVGTSTVYNGLPPCTPRGSLAHPEWPYAGTGFEWRKFVRS